jgi:hypothetical protein
MDGIVDTTVFVHVLRGDKNATLWLISLPNLAITPMDGNHENIICNYSALERIKQGLRRLRRFFSFFNLGNLRNPC